MKRILIYILILNALWFAPLDRVDVADLEPVRGVFMYTENGKLALKTDTGAYGAGDGVEDALQNLKNASPGIVYLDTAEYVLLSENAIGFISQLTPHIKKSALLCLWDGEGEMEGAIKYAHAHKLGTKICHWKTGDKLPNLRPQKSTKKGGMPS